MNQKIITENKTNETQLIEKKKQIDILEYVNQQLETSIQQLNQQLKLGLQSIKDLIEKIDKFSDEIKEAQQDYEIQYQKLQENSADEWLDFQLQNQIDWFQKILIEQKHNNDELNHIRNIYKQEDFFVIAFEIFLMKNSLIESKHQSLQQHIKMINNELEQKNKMLIKEIEDTEEIIQHQLIKEQQQEAQEVSHHQNSKEQANKKIQKYQAQKLDNKSEIQKKQQKYDHNIFKNKLTIKKINK